MSDEAFRRAVCQVSESEGMSEEDAAAALLRLGGAVAAQPGTTVHEELDAATAELEQLRRWLRAVSLGRATKDIHAEIRAYLGEAS